MGQRALRFVQGERRIGLVDAGRSQRARVSRSDPTLQFPGLLAELVEVGLFGQ